MRMYHVMLSSGVEPSLASSLSSVVVSYVGPDQLLPLASALGASVGVLLLVWHHVVAWGHRAWRLCTKKKGDKTREVLHTAIVADRGCRQGWDGTCEGQARLTRDI